MKEIDNLDCDYLIYISGTAINAVNGMTGNIDYSGTNAATVIQNAIDALPTRGGIIHLKRGQYNLTKGLKLDGLNANYEDNKSFIFEGEGANNTRLYNTSTDPTILFKATHSTIKNLRILGNGTTSGHGILMQAISYGGFAPPQQNNIIDCYINYHDIGIKFDAYTFKTIVGNCYIDQNRSHGVHLASAVIPGDPNPLYSVLNTFIDCTITSNGGDGVRLDGGNTNTFIGCEVANNQGYGFNINTDTTLIMQCYTENNSLGAGIYINNRLDTVIISHSILDGVVYGGNSRFYNTFIDGRTITAPIVRATQFNTFS